MIARRSNTFFPALFLALLAGCGGGGGLVAIITAVLLSGAAAPTVPLVIFPGQEKERPAALLPFTAEVRALAITPNGAKLYAADTLHNTVSVIDTATRRTMKVMDAMGTGPRFIAISLDGRKALVANFGTLSLNNSIPDNTVSIIDTGSDAVTATLTVGRGPFAIAITPNSAKAYVANSVDNSLSVINLANNTVTTTLAVGTEPVAVVITSDGAKAFVANRGSDNITEIDVASDQVLRTEPVGDVPTGLALHPDDTFLYVTNRGDGASAGTVSVIDVASGAVQNTLTVGTGPMAAAMSPNGQRVYVAQSFNGREDDLCGSQSTALHSVRVIDVATQTVLPGEIAVGDAPLAVVVTGDNAKLYAVSSCSDPATDRGTVSVVNTAAITSNANINATAINLPTRATAAALAPNSSRLYVAHPHAVSVLDVASNSLVGSPIAVRGDGPTKLALSASGAKLYAIRPGANAVAVLDVNAATGLLQWLGNVTVGNQPSDLRITARPAGTNQVYITNAGYSRFPDSRVSVLDVTGPGSVDTTADTVSILDSSGFPVLGYGPLSLAFNADVSRVFTATFGDYFSNDPTTNNLGASIAMIDDAQPPQVTHFVNYGQQHVAVTVDPAVGLDNFGQIDLGASDGVLYAVDFLGNQIVRGRSSNPNIAFTVGFQPDIDSPMGIAISPGHRAYTANYRTVHNGVQDLANVTEIDLDSTTITKQLAGMNPGHIAITPDGDNAYVLHTGDRQFRCGANGTRFCATGDTVSIITLPFSGAPLTRSLAVGAHPTGIAFTPNIVAVAQRALVTNYYGGSVSIIAPWQFSGGSTPVVTATVPVGAGPTGIIINNAGTRAYVANSVSNTISVIAVDSGTVLGTVSLGP